MVYIPLEPIITAHPRIQAVYLFGSRATRTDTPASDVDIAVLLPFPEAKAVGSLALSALHLALENQLGLPVDLVNLRLVSTVFQKEIIASGIRIFCSDDNEADQFEMLVLSFYGRLNDERSAILSAFGESLRAYDV